MSRAKDTENAALALFLGIIFMVPYATFVNAYVIMQVWKWHIVPTFEFEPLTVIQAAGLSLFIGIFTAGLKQADNDSKAETVTGVLVYKFVTFTAVALFTLAFAFVLTWFQ